MLSMGAVSQFLCLAPQDVAGALVLEFGGDAVLDLFKGWCPRGLDLGDFKYHRTLRRLRNLRAGLFVRGENRINELWLDVNSGHRIIVRNQVAADYLGAIFACGFVHSLLLRD